MSAQERGIGRRTALAAVGGGLAGIRFADTAAATPPQTPRPETSPLTTQELAQYLSTEPVNSPYLGSDTLADLAGRGRFKYQVVSFGSSYDFYLTDRISARYPLSSRRLPYASDATSYPRDEGFDNFSGGTKVALSTGIGVVTEDDFGPGWLNQIAWAATRRDDGKLQFNAIMERDVYNRFSGADHGWVEKYQYLRSETFTPQLPGDYSNFQVLDRRLIGQ